MDNEFEKPDVKAAPPCITGDIFSSSEVAWVIPSPNAE
jgi:hypothetical protein